MKVSVSYKKIHRNNLGPVCRWQDPYREGYIFVREFIEESWDGEPEHWEDYFHYDGERYWPWLYSGLEDGELEVIFIPKTEYGFPTGPVIINKNNKAEWELTT
jgi:hypothetical protein